MPRSRTALALLAIAAVLGSTAPARSSQDNPTPLAEPNLAGLHDFDFLAGSWKVRHQRLKERLAGSHAWEEFDGTCTMRPLMGGYANVDDNVMELPSGTYQGVGLRSYDPKSGQWAIWWLDSRNPFGDLDPPVKGRFENGVGTFTSNDTLRGKPVRVRFTWSQITPTSAHWEQAFSPDGGKTWEVNWRMEFTRVP